MIGALRSQLSAAFEVGGAEPPRDLWHLLLFVTAGEAVRRTLAADGMDDYRPFGERTGVYRRGAWARG